MRKAGQFFSGRVKTTNPDNVSADRYDFIRLEEAEPNLGVAAADESILFTGQTGLREWISLSPDLELNANNELSIAAGIVQTINDIALANTDFQDVTDVGATTTNRIGVSGIDVTNDIVAADLYLGQNGTIVFEGSSNNAFETTLTVTNPSADRTITIPNVTGTVVTTGNASDLGASLGNLIIGSDIAFATQYDYIVQSGATSYKLDPQYAVAGKVVIAEAVDASQNANYNIVMAQLDNGNIATGSGTTSRDLMVDSGGLTFNPATNQFTTQIIVGASVVASPLITSTQENPTVVIQGSGATGVVRINDSLHVHDQVVHVNDNLATWNTNSDLGIVGHYATGANTAATSIVAGTEYQIVSLGTTTPWTSIGATTAEIGQTFTATGSGSGDGVAVETSTQNAAFFGVDRSDLTFKYYDSGSYTDSVSYNDKVWTGTLGSAEFGGLTVAGQVYPASIGANNQVFGVVDSATGELGYFSATLTDTNTTYTLASIANTAINEGLLRFTELPSTSNDIKFAGSGATTISSNATHIIVNSSDTNDNDYLTGLSFDTANGVLTATVSNQSDVTVDLDGRYAPAGALTAESDTLQSVTDRGATSTNAISITDTAVSSNTTTGALTVAGGVGIGGKLNVGSSLTAGQTTLSVSSALQFPSYTHALLLKNTSTAGGTTAIKLETNNGNFGSIVIGSTAGASSYGTFFVAANNSVKILEGNTTAISIPLTTASSNTTTGALTVAGGVGIAGDVYVGGGELKVTNSPSTTSSIISEDTFAFIDAKGLNQVGAYDGTGVATRYFAQGNQVSYVGIAPLLNSDESLVLGTYTNSGGTGDIAFRTPNGRAMLIDHSETSVNIEWQKLKVGDTANTTATSIIEGSGTIWIDPAPIAGDANGVVIIKGDLQVDGTTTTLNSTTLTIDDLNIVVASGAADSAAASGAGLTVDGANKSITWNHAGQYFTADSNFEADGFVVSGQTGFLKADGTVDSTVYSTTDTNTAYNLVSPGTTGVLRLQDSSNANDDITFIGSGATTVTSNSTHIIVNSTDNNDNTTYSIALADGSAGETKINLTASTGGTDEVTLKAGTNVSLTRVGDVVTFSSTDTDTNTTYNLQVDVNAAAGSTDLALVDSGAVKDLVTFAGAGNIQVNRVDTNTFQITDDITPTYIGTGAKLSITNNSSTTPVVTGIEDLALDVAGNTGGSIARFRRNVVDTANGGGVIRIELGENTGAEGDPWITFENYGTTGSTNAKQGEIGTTHGQANPEGTNGMRLWGQDAIDFDVNDGDEFGEDGNLPDSVAFRRMSVREDGIILRNGTPIYYHPGANARNSGDTASVAYNAVGARVTKLEFNAPTAARIITFPDASGTVALTSDIPTDTNTTYNLLSPGTTGVMRLQDSANSNDDITFIGSGATSVTSNATHVIISSTDTNTDTNTTYDMLPVANTLNGVIRLDPSAGANDDVAIFGSGATSVTSNSLGIYISSTDTNTDTNTTYAISAVDVTGGKAIRLTAGGSGSGTDDVVLKAGTNVSLARVGDEITISSTDTNTDTNTTYNLVSPGTTGVLRLQDSANSNDDITFVGSGATSVTSNSTHVIISSTDTNTDTNNYVSALAWDANTGIVTASRSGLTALTVDIDGRYPDAAGTFGVVPSYTQTSFDSITYSQDNQALEFRNLPDITSGIAFPAFRVNNTVGETWKLDMTFKGSVAASTGVYFRVYEYNGELPIGKTHISGSAVLAQTQQATAGFTTWKENGPITVDWETSSYTYTPNAGATWASIEVLNWTGFGGSIYLKKPAMNCIPGIPAASDTLQSVAVDGVSATRYITFVNSTSGAQTAGVDTALTFNPSLNNLDLNGTMTIDCGDTATGLSVRGTSGAGNTGRISLGFGDGPNNPKIQWDDVNNDMFWGMGSHDTPNNMYLWGTGGTSLPSFTSHAGGVTSQIQFEFTTTGDLNLYGGLTAATKSFVIPHPTKDGMKLRYGSLEGPENGVYVRGRLKDDNTIELPDYWTGLIDEDSITVNLTPIGKHQKLYVEDILDNKIIVGNENLMSKSINCFYTVFAERKDVDKLTVEYEA